MLKSWEWPGEESRCSHPVRTVIMFFISQSGTNSHTITVPEEVTTYTTLIADVQDVHDESSDFELPDTVVA